MSAAEIIEQIKALPPEELAKVLAYVRSVEEVESASPERPRYVDDRKIEEIADDIFGKHEELFKKLAE